MKSAFQCSGEDNVHGWSLLSMIKFSQTCFKFLHCNDANEPVATYNTPPPHLSKLITLWFWFAYSEILSICPISGRNLSRASSLSWATFTRWCRRDWLGRPDLTSVRRSRLDSLIPAASPCTPPYITEKYKGTITPAVSLCKQSHAQNNGKTWGYNKPEYNIQHIDKNYIQPQIMRDPRYQV